MRLALFTLAPALVLGACVSHGDEGMVVLNNTAVGAATSCSLSGDPSQPFQPMGMISTLSPGPYLVTPLIQSRITADPTNAGQITQRTIQLQGAHIHLSFPAGSTTVTTDPGNLNFDALFSADLPPQGTANVAFGLIPAGLIADAGKLGGTVHIEVLADVTIFGSLGGDRVDASPWQYPVTICNDCVVNNLGTCTMGITASNKGNPCNVFQDGVVDCCTDGTTGAIRCPAM